MLRLSAALSALALAACQKPLSADECSALLDRYTELLAGTEGRSPSAEEILRLQRDARARAAESPEFSRCTDEVSRSEWECAMKAPTVDEIEKCLL